MSSSTPLRNTYLKTQLGAPGAATPKTSAKSESRKDPSRMFKLAHLAVPALAAAASFALFAGPASATSGAHFFNDTAASVSSTGALVVSIDEAGVGQALVSYDLNWSATADYGCINGGGNHPQATNKDTVTTEADATFSESPINGRVHADFTVPGTPPPITNGFTCPSGQTLILADVSYKATLTDNTNNVSKSLSASATFVTFKK